MFNDIFELEKEMKNELIIFIEKSFEKNNYKYFYDTTEDLRKLLELEFSCINFNLFDKNILKEIEKFEIQIAQKVYQIKIDKMSIRGEFSILNLSKIAKEKSKKQYLKEYLLYYTLKNISTISPSIVNRQKNNFLYIFIKEYNTREFRLMKEKKYLKALNSIDYYQKLKGKEEISSLEQLYMNKDYKDKAKIIFPYKNLNLIDDLNRILTEIYLSSKDSHKKYFYRGQNNSNWVPSASIIREKEYLKNEHLMFYKIISKMPKAFENDKYIYNQIATMQHFGYPTRLIDITENPLIALYFACDGNFEYDGEIFIYESEEDEILNFEDKKLRCLEQIPTNSFEDICKECNKLEFCKKEIIKKSYIVQGVAKNERINNQSGSFIFVGISNEEKYCKNEIKKPIMSIILDKTMKKGILEILEKLNINGGTVYPDLLNLAKFLKNKYKN